MVLLASELNNSNHTYLGNIVKKIEQDIDEKLAQNKQLVWNECRVFDEYDTGDTLKLTDFGKLLANYSDQNRSIIRQKVVKDYREAGWQVTWNQEPVTLRQYNGAIEKFNCLDIIGIHIAPREYVEAQRYVLRIHL